MKNFLSCDWGTTNFRLRLVNADDLSIVAEYSSGQGIAAVHNTWKKSTGDRAPFYAPVLAEGLVQLKHLSGTDIDGLNILISGMASSTLGILELPYAHLPFGAEGDGAQYVTFRMPGVDHEITLISGLQTTTDVMRGEETQWLGLMNDALLQDIDELLVILPGTHSKHITVSKRKIVDFKTYMTGEFFNLLADHSVLRNSVAPGSVMQNADDRAAFKAGVQASVGNDLLHQSFIIRTNDLFKKYPLHQNTFYLSGLLIGTELQHIGDGIVALAAGNSLLESYRQSLEIIGHSGRMIIFSAGSLDRALIKGQLIIFNRNKITQ